MKNKPLTIAHRGYSAKFPENSLIAFEEAIKSGAQMIEFDVHLTADQDLVVTHDYVLGRIIKPQGEKGHIDDYTLSQCQQMGLPSLKEVLVLVNKRVALNVELKHETLKSPMHYEGMAQKVLDLIDVLDYRELVIISSFDETVLRTLRSLDSHIALGVLDHTPEINLKCELAKELKAKSYHPHFLHLNRAIVHQLHSQGLLIYPYTANTYAEFQRLLDLGVDGVITNEVGEFLVFLTET